MIHYPALEDIVPEYHSRNWIVRRLFESRLEEALKLGKLNTKESLEILDIGCGEGRLLRILRNSYSRHIITGMDHNPNVNSIKIQEVTVKQLDLTIEPLPENKFNRIFCLDVLEHIKDLKLPLQSISGALCSHGLLIISVPTENFFQKVCRFMIKGTFSSLSGPSSGPHYYNARTLFRNVVNSGLEPIDETCLPAAGCLALIRLFSFLKKD